MDTALLIALAASVTLLLVTIRLYERRIEALEADLAWAVELLDADPDELLRDIGRSA